MWNPRPVRQLRDLSAWHLNSHRVARRNALDAHRALAHRRRERVEVEQFLEGFQWHGVKRGEAHDFYADDIGVEGPHPFLSSGGNNGTGRNRAVLFSDSLEQLRGTAGPRQVTVRAETALAGCNTPDSCGFIMLSKYPS